MADTTKLGQFFDIANSGNLYKASVSGVTVPVIASGLVSVFTLNNPVSSTVNLVPVFFEVGIVLATTVVNAVNLYGQFGLGSTTAALASVTAGTAVQCKFNAAAANVGQFLTAATHTGTPTRIETLATFGATSAAIAAPILKYMHGSLILPPGSAVSVAMSTGASTASGLALGVCWAEVAIN